MSLVAPATDARKVDTGQFGVSHFLPVPLPGRWTYFPAQYDTKPLIRAVRGQLSTAAFDAALLFSGTEFLARTIEGFPPVVSDRIDCMTLTAWHHLRKLEGLRSWLERLHHLTLVFRYERSVARLAHSTITVGDEDGRWLRRLLGTRNVHVIPNGVEVGPDPGATEESCSPRVVFSGVMDYPPNVDAVEHFVDRVWPSIRAAHPKARFRIVGRQPAPQVEALRAVPGVDVTGEVPRMHTELAAAWVAVAPIRLGSGVRNKVLEAWAAGTPVVMTSMATNGLPAAQGFADLVCDHPRDMASVIVRLLSDPDERARLGRASYAAAQAQSWKAAGAEVDEVLRAAAAVLRHRAPADTGTRSTRTDG